MPYADICSVFIILDTGEGVKTTLDQPWLQHYNTTTLQLYNTTPLQLYNTTTLQHYTTTTLQHHNTTTLQHYNSTTLQHYTTTTPQHYNTTTTLQHHHVLQAVPWHIDVHSDKRVEVTVESLVALTANQLLGKSQISVKITAIIDYKELY